MIIDKISNFKLYNFGQYWNKCFEFIQSINKDILPKDYQILNSDVIAKVFEYKTKNRECCILESHIKFIDIHVTLNIPEIVEYHNPCELTISKEYDAIKDFTTYVIPSEAKNRFILDNNYFVVFFPNEPHLTQMCHDNKLVQNKKLVVKFNPDFLPRISHKIS